MKLYLSSIGIPNTQALLSLFQPQTKLSVALIPNAWDVYPKDRSQQEIDSTKSAFAKIGFTVSLIDLKVTNGNQLKDELARHSLVWVMGGNTFYLNQKMHESGFDKIIAQLLDDGLVYGGESAGAVIAGSTIHGVELLDDPKEASKVFWDGLKLIDFSIVPHWGMEKYSETLEKCKVEMEKFTDTKTISNDQAIIYQGEKVRLVEKKF